MRSLLAEHFRQVRTERNISLSQLAKRVGYQNVTKGCNRIQTFEQSGEIHVDLLRKLAETLDVDEATVDRLIEQDDREFVRRWNEWADQPIRPYLVIRLIPAVYKSESLPEEVQTLEEAEAVAAERARHWSKKVCLVWTRRFSVWLNERGEVEHRREASPERRNAPYLRLKNDRQRFLLTDRR